MMAKIMTDYKAIYRVNLIWFPYLLFFYLLTAYIYSPGLTTPDSENQIMQGLSHVYNNGHPPFVTMLWGMLLRGNESPSLIFIAHTTLFWFSTGLILLLSRNYLQFVFGVILIGFNPFIYNYVGNIWKDVLIYDFYLLVVALSLYIYFQIIKSNKLLYWTIWILIVFFTTSRWNIFLSGFMLSMLLKYSYTKCEFNFLQCVLEFIKFTVGFILAQVIIQYMLTPINAYPQSMLFVYDLVGMSVIDNIYRLPATEQFDVQYLHGCYDYQSWDRIWVQCMPLLDELRSTEKWRQLYTYWFQAIIESPLTYFEHRFNYFIGEFYINKLIFTYDPTQLTYKYGFNQSLPFYLIAKIYKIILESPLYIFFTNGCWFLITLIFTFYTFITRQAYFISLLALSGFFYIWPMFFVSTGYDFRYVYWGIGAVFISVYLSIFFDKEQANA